jgi:squalene-hopene/tetraprenyl-beta-curcumene cyclase
MQNRDGGWGAFDRDNDHEFLCHVPFADHNAMIDPSTPDLAGRVLEMLGELGRGTGSPAIDRAVDYVRRAQQSDGSWFGRWGVNYIYGTWQALVGLAAVGVPASDPMMAAGARWLVECQQASGGWGESPESYARAECRGRGPVTASQTAWALLGLIAAGQARHPAVTRGIEYLVSTQRDDGTWDEREFTGTGFPQVFYLRYHYYPIYFPLLALVRWPTAIAAE